MEELLNKYLENRCTPEEIQQVLQHLNTAEGRAYFDNLLQTADFDNTALQAVPSERLWQRIGASLSLTNREKATVRGRMLPLWSVRLGRVAAVLLPLLVAGWWYLNRSIEVHTPYGQTQQIKLPDGSEVTLNGNSTLTYEARWKDAAPRQVWLSGEAFFRVTHQANQQPFLVHTQHQHVVEVLGTEFNVNDRSQRTRVVLQSGKIKLFAKQKEANNGIIMQPGQLAEIDTALPKPVINTVNVALFTSWRQQKLIFEGTPLAEIAVLLKETYNLDVRVNNPHLLKEKITGTLPSGNVKDLINALSLALQVKYVQTDNTVHFF